MLRVALCFSALAMVMAVPPHLQRVKEYPLNVLEETAAPITISTIFYTPNQGLSKNAIDYWMFQMCSAQPTSGYLRILINPPDNTNMNTNATGFPVLEVGTSPTTFSANTVLATNYKWGSEVTACDVVEIPYTANTFVASTVYVRVSAKTNAVQYALQVVFSSTSSGGCPGASYDTRAFNTQVVNQNFQYFLQYATSGNTPVNAVNNQRTYFFVQFCQTDLTTGAYQVAIDAIFSPSKPRSIFNLYACRAAQFTMSTCTENTPEVEDLETAPFTHVELSNSLQFPLTTGIWVLVIGLGGELDNNNALYLNAKIQFN